MPFPYPTEIKNSRVMVFVDGENLAIRYANLLSDKQPFKHVQFERDTYVWSPLLDGSSHRTVNTVRRYYYTSVRGDEDHRNKIHDKLYALGIQAPRVFPKNKSRGSQSASTFRSL